MLILISGCTSDPPPVSDDFDLQGHRGARGLLPENTVDGFLRALDLGVNTLELDVVVSADSQLVVSHEPWMSHAICSTPEGEPIEEDTRDRYNLYQMPYSDIQQYDCGSRGNAGFPEQEARPTFKPLLTTVIDSVEAYRLTHNLPEVRYNVETKSSPNGDGFFHPNPNAFARLVHTTLSERGVLDRSTVQSFDVRTLQAMRAIDDEVQLALLVGDTDPLETHLDVLGFVPEIYSPHYRLVDEALVHEVQERGMKLIPWTVNSVDDMQRLVELGVDGLITDYPDRFSAVRRTGS